MPRLPHLSILLWSCIVVPDICKMCHARSGIAEQLRRVLVRSLCLQQHRRAGRYVEDLRGVHAVRLHGVQSRRQDAVGDHQYGHFHTRFAADHPVGWRRIWARPAGGRNAILASNGLWGHKAGHSVRWDWGGTDRPNAASRVLTTSGASLAGRGAAGVQKLEMPSAEISTTHIF